ncbi:hypothetical protein DOT_0627 [Desulfosporosinus sp. OT]|nr:hypothetical protein DOT_0627 [Desulfosporosinus sp. OT]
MPDRLVWLFCFYWIIFTILGGDMGEMWNYLILVEYNVSLKKKELIKRPRGLIKAGIFG